MDEVTISAPQLWSEDRGPIPPKALQIAINPLRHFTVYDRVEAMIRLEFVASRSRSASQRWACSVENRVTLVDHPSVTPSLWDLRKNPERGRSELWLALFDQKTGPFRAILRVRRMRRDLPCGCGGHTPRALARMSWECSGRPARMTRDGQYL
jgi:hypothetical protein